MLERRLSADPPRARLPGAAQAYLEGILFRILDAENGTGVQLTESYAMWPGSSVSGLYLSHPVIALFRRRQDRARSGRGLCEAQERNSVEAA